MAQITNPVHHHFHLDLSDAHTGETYFLHANGKSYPVVEHTPHSIAQLKKHAPYLADTPENELTHYVKEAVPLPKDQAIRVHVKHTLDSFNLPNTEGAKGSFHSAIIVPPEAMLKARKDAAVKSAPTDSPSPSGSTPASGPHHHINWTSTAVALAFHHADLITHNATYAATIINYMTDQTHSPVIVQKVEKLANKMKSHGPPTPKGTSPAGWAVLEPVVVEKPDPKTGDPSHIKKSTHYQQNPTDDVTKSSEAGDLLTSMMLVTKNDMTLKNKKWMQEHGTAVEVAPDGSPHLLANLTRPTGEFSADSGDDWTPALSVTGEQHGLTSSISNINQSKTQVTLNMKNHWVRWLGVYISFKDTNGNLIDISTHDFGVESILDKAVEQNNNYRFIGYLEPVNTILAIPISSDPGQLSNGNNVSGDGVTITFPANAVSASIHGAGLGTGSIPYGGAIVFGGLATILANIAIPSIMIGFAVAMQKSKSLYKILSEPALIKVFVMLGASLFAGMMGKDAKQGKVNWRAITMFGQIIFNVAMYKVCEWLSRKIIEGEAEDEIPFLGWVATAVSIAEDIAQLAETIVEIAKSPWFIENQMSLTIDTALTVKPDPRANGQWPQAAAGQTATCHATMVYQSQTRPAIAAPPYTVPSENPPPSISLSFPSNTLGGKIKIEVEYFINHWLAGKATSGWIENNNKDAANITMYLVEMPKPIKSDTVYQHTSILQYDKTNSAYIWHTTNTVPGNTMANLSDGTGENQISECVDLTLSQQNGVLASSCKAAGTGTPPATGSGYSTQLFTMLSVNIPGVSMNDVNFVTAGFTQRSQMVYDPYPPKFKMKKGNWVIGTNGKPEPDSSNVNLGSYYIDPTKSDNPIEQDGGFHLRKVTVTGEDGFNTNPSTSPLSHGRFPFSPDKLCMHPSGHIIGINQQGCKVMVCNVGQKGVADKDSPVAITNAGQAMTKEREGLLFAPIAVGCSHDGTVLVLDQVYTTKTKTARIQAFDLLGRPVSCFTDSSENATPFIPLPGTKAPKGSGAAQDITYLDLSVVGNKHMTYMFILYYLGGGTQTSEYNVAIYGYKSTSTTNDLAPIVTATTVPAASIAVDMWHTLYSQNYQMTTDSNGTPAGPSNDHTGPDGRTATSISEWIINNP